MSRLTPEDRTHGFVEHYAREPRHVTQARARAEEIGCSEISASCGSVLSMLAKALDARSILEIGAGTGVSTLWMLQNINHEIAMTSINPEGEHHLLARENLGTAGVLSQKMRFITGKLLEVIPRMAADSYDMVVINVSSQELAEVVEASLRLVRSNGLLIITHALSDGRIVDPSHRDPDTVARRSVINSLNLDERVYCTLLPVAEGMLVCSVQQA